jgi:hypothetical protein
MLKPERILLAILGSTSVLTAVALVVVVLAAGLALRPGAGPGRAERTFRAAGAACFGAFLTGVACAALSVWYLIQQHHTIYVVVVVFFLLQLALLTLAALQVFLQAVSRSRPRIPARGDVSPDRARSSGPAPRPGQ